MFEIHDDEIDVQAIMATIRDNLKKRRSSAALLDDKMIGRSPSQGALLSPVGTADYRLNLMRMLQDPKPQGPIASHGSLMRARIKGFIRRTLTPYHRAIFARQAEFNANAVGLITELQQTLEQYNRKHGAVFEEILTDLHALNVRQPDHVNLLIRHQGHLRELQSKHEVTMNQLEKLTGRLDATEGDLSRRLDATEGDLSRRLDELRREVTLQKRRLELILSELRQKIEGDGKSLEKLASMKDRLMDHIYLRFEDHYRLSREEIRKRQEIYMPLFKDRHASSEHEATTVPSPILDVGCGRGEFLELLRENGIPAKGIDLNEDMIYCCRERALDVEQANALDYLLSRPDDSLRGIFACQVIEHLPVDEMIELVKLCYQKIEKGGLAVFETVNPLSLVVSATNFYTDLSHVRQIPPSALQFLARSIGFINTEIKFLSPYPEESMLHMLDTRDDASQQINKNFRRLNDILFGYQDYALICEK